jgi:hypothetical protein
MSALARIQTPYDIDPALLGYPPLLPVELALREHTPQQVCEAYGITAEQWDVIRQSPVFVNDLKARMIELQADGVSFKMKARLQSSEYLKKLWKITEETGAEGAPVAVRADIMKFIIRAAGLDGSKDQANAAVAAGNALSITLHLR